MGVMENKRVVKLTERGWAGHFICADGCQFRRNTLLECGDTRVVVSTVGNWIRNEKPQKIGAGRYYETMAFFAKYDDPYWDADVTKKICSSSRWEIAKCNRETDAEANDMHENVLVELSAKILNGCL